jgi:hypothetical protein
VKSVISRFFDKRRGNWESNKLGNKSKGKETWKKTYEKELYHHFYA